MTTAAIPVDELVPPPEQLFTILFLIYVYFCKNVLLIGSRETSHCPKYILILYYNGVENVPIY